MHVLFNRRNLLAAGAAGLASAALARTLSSDIPTARDFGAIGDGRADDTAAIRAALAAVPALRFDEGTYRITDELRLRSGQRVELSPGVTISQHVRGKSAFVALRAQNVSIDLNGGAVRGPGGWSKLWTGMQGQEGSRGVRFLGCTASHVAGPGRVYNWGSAAIDITGGSDVECRSVTVEGTHLHGRSLDYLDNNQIGIYIVNDPVYGPANNIRVSQCEIAGVTQGVLREALPSPVPTGATLIDRCVFRDIPGQHGVYNQESHVTVTDCQFSRIALSAVKNQSGDAGRVLRNLTATGIVGDDLGGSLFEVATPSPHRGGIDGIVLEGRGRRVGRLLSVARNVRNLRAVVAGDTIRGDAVSLDKANLHAIDISVDARIIAQHGVIVSATNSSGIRIRPKIDQANSYSGRPTTFSGVLVESASAGVVDLVDAQITDPTGKMFYGVFNSIAGSEVRLSGTTRISGASSMRVRATGRVVGLP
ncbi:hypothetical protein [Sphingosinicella sp. LY1275]|uniref:hypothetical protein n=1 Tax=Sphingosinicella sp. LY1275 TaxID=3095379 RepID=UPI002ADECF80|nr:hypothetical protein [Sphingosinicella sp. LY1275]MEA1014481.1 hypothetical protein [Sphingosinicella sp. LY1275]